ncbi:MAG: GST-like protein, partial [Gammaproteobacteria bacterium]
MLKFYFSPAPNPMKVALFLEESGLPYEAIPVDTRKGEQHSAQFLSRNPNAKLPVIDDDGAIVFDSNAILLYLGEKTGQFMPGDSSNERGQLLSWLMFIASGIGPYSGQAVHFNRYAPEPIPYAKNRYNFEA